MTRTKAIKKNSLFGIFYQVISLLLPFVVRTVVLKVLGAEYTGLGSLFTSILQVLNVAELGFSSAITFSLYKPIAENNVDEIRSLLALYRKIYLIVGAIILSVGLIILPLLPYLISGSYPDDINLYLLYSLFLVNTCLSYFVLSYKSVILTADQKQYVISIIGTIVLVIKTAIQIVALLVTKNYYFYYSFTIIFTIIYNIILAIIVSKKYPEYYPKGKVEKERLKAIKKEVRGLAIGKICKVSRNSLDSIVLSIFCGLVELTIYANYYYVFSAVYAILGVFTTAITASVGNSIAMESLEKNYSDFKKYEFYFAWIGSLFTIALLCCYQLFMNIWVGEELMAPNITMFLFSIYFYINQSGQTKSAYSNACGIWWKMKFINISEVAFNILLNFILGYFYGMNGIIIATIITVFVHSLILSSFIFFKEVFKISPIVYFFEHLVYGVLTFGAAVLTYFVCSKIFISIPIVRLIVVFLVSILIPTLLFFIVSLTNRVRRNYLEELFKRVFTHK